MRSFNLQLYIECSLRLHYSPVLGYSKYEFLLSFCSLVKLSYMKPLPAVSLVLVFLLSACQAESGLDFATPVSVEEQVQAYLQETQTAMAEESSFNAGIQSESTPDVEASLNAEDWMNWPIIPEATDTAREIYRRGLAMGNNPHAFSKVGDGQNLSRIFLGVYDHPLQRGKSIAAANLVDTIDYFTGCFNRDGQAVRADFTAPSVLSQSETDPEVCLPDENPLECELRIHRPTFVLISLEVPFPERTPEVYERYLRQIIDYVISQGAVPILATKADNLEKDYSINLTTARLAVEYDIPLWNWWEAAQPLANHGIDSYRNGFFISEQAWDERNKTFLQTLDHLWESLETAS